MYKRHLTKSFLENLYRKYNHLNSSDDPILWVFTQSAEKDRELLGFLASLLAFGNIKQINNTLNKLFLALYPSSYQKISDLKFLDYLKKNYNIHHRFLKHSDLIGVLETLNIVYNEYGGLKSLFLKSYNPSYTNLKSVIINFSKSLREIHSSRSKIETWKLKFLYPSPENGSACKRINLFLRWMVRKDNIDLGLWNEIKTSQLIIPLDTHIIQFAKTFGLTRLKSPSWNMAVEITERLKKFDSNDPVKYDFALSHLKLRNRR